MIGENKDNFCKNFKTHLNKSFYIRNITGWYLPTGKVSPVYHGYKHTSSQIF